MKRDRRSWRPVSLFGGKDSEDYKYFSNDFQPHRLTEWTSIWLQCAPVARREDVHSVLEFGSGRNLTSFISDYLGISHTTVDVSNRFHPDHVASILDFPFTGETYDLVCSFQCLEHNPYDQLDELVAHMIEFTRRYLYVSLPYGGASFSFSFGMRIPKFHMFSVRSFTMDFLGGRRIDVEPFRSYPPERRHSPHWWEVGRPGAGKKAVIAKFESHALRLLESFHNPFYPHHLFLLFEKK